MKRILLSLALLICSHLSFSQGSLPFRFAFVSDTHIGSPDGASEEDLRRTVADINSMSDIAFVVITGDITELGTNAQLHLARQILDSLRVKWYIIPGNHDAGWSESGGLMFAKVFGADHFSFEYAGIRFLGCASGPYVRMSDGHVPRDAVNWLDTQLTSVRPGQPVIFLNHYPINEELDNWYEITSRLHQQNTWAILCGHGHANKGFTFEDIPGVMGRSNLRAKAAEGGYNLVDVTGDRMTFSERRPGVTTLDPWIRVRIATRHYDVSKTYPRPDYAMNSKYPGVQEKWRYSSAANVISTPAVEGDDVVFGNQSGLLCCLSLTTGKRKWEVQLDGSIFSTPAIHGDRIFLGSAGGSIYSIDRKKGMVQWKVDAGVPVLGCPVVRNETVYIGGSGKFFALDMFTGKERWTYGPLGGPVVSTPVLDGDRLIFGAWDTYLYSLNARTGNLQWKWTNGSTIRNYSPAACIPVIHDSVVYVVAPDRYITAIDENTGATLWRNNDTRVRESIGKSADGRWIYGKTMQDTIVAYAASRSKQNAAWTMNCGFGYEHVPSMLIESDGRLFFGTRNGVVYGIDPYQQKMLWSHKIDNSMVNTVRVLNGKSLVVSTMDGKVVRLETDR